MKLLKDYTTEELANITPDEKRRLIDAEYYYRTLMIDAERYSRGLKPTLLDGKDEIAMKYRYGIDKYHIEKAIYWARQVLPQKHKKVQ